MEYIIEEDFIDKEKYDIQIIQNLSIEDAYKEIDALEIGFNEKETLRNLLWTNIIQKRIMKRGIDFDKFVQIMNKHNLIISGSFIVQVLLNENYGTSDIDVWSNNISQNLLKEFQEVLNLKFDLYADLTIQGNAQVYGNIGINKIYNNDNIYGNLNVQLIETKNNNINYLDSFDLDICKNYWDGKTFHVNNLNNLINKKAVFKMSYAVIDKFNCTKMLERIIKYKKRNFEINFSLTFINDLLYFIQENHPDYIYDIGGREKHYCDLVNEFKEIMNLTLI